MIRFRWFSGLAGFLLFAQIAWGASEFNKTLLGGLAIKGYDPVAYFEGSGPIKGNKSFAHTWKGARWLFASEEHRARFAAEPEKFAPQYGGYCAWAVAQGYTADIDPTAWRVVEGRLYLNYDANVQEKWLKDVPGHIRKADENWPKLRDR